MKRLLAETVSDKFKLYRISGLHTKRSFAEDVDRGLSSKKKFLEPKYFYDDDGSVLFEKITKTKEYYLTRIESSIIEKYSDDIAANNKNKKVIVELGSGASKKTRNFLVSFLNSGSSVKYIPIDVSEIMIESSDKLVNQLAGLKVEGILSEYEDGLKLVKEIDADPTLFLFLGSSIGNFSKSESVEFIKLISSCLHHHDRLLIGFDMVKSKEILHDAYNDSEGYTEQFNKNILLRINKELGGQFNISSFRHYAFFNEKESRIEMHLISKENQFVFIKNIGKEYYFAKGESIHTENSYKFNDSMIEEIAEEADLRIIKKYSDELNYFSLVEFELNILQSTPES